MVNKLQIDKMIRELEWVISITKSVKSRDQLITSSKCFFLWEKKYKSLINQELPYHPFRGKFWATYKNKESELSILALSE